MDALVFFDRPGNPGWAVAGKIWLYRKNVCNVRRGTPDISMDGIFCVSMFLRHRRRKYLYPNKNQDKNKDIRTAEKEKRGAL